MAKNRIIGVVSPNWRNLSKSPDHRLSLLFEPRWASCNTASSGLREIFGVGKGECEVGPALKHDPALGHLHKSMRCHSIQYKYRYGINICWIVW